MTYIGIDPGRNGGLSIVKGLDDATAYELPDNLSGAKEILERIQTIQDNGTKVVCGIEKVTANPMFGAVGNWVLSQSFTMWDTVMQLFSVPVILIPSKDWQKTVHLKKKKGESVVKWKTRLMDEVLRMYPNVDWPSDTLGIKRNVADSVLIAHHLLSKYAS